MTGQDYSLNCREGVFSETSDKRDAADLPEEYGGFVTLAERCVAGAGSLPQRGKGFEVCLRS